MKPDELISILKIAGRLKETTRHCFLESGRQESVAEHSWRMALMAMLLEDEFDCDIHKVIQMCLIHDLGEVFTGDIPTFQKNDDQRHVEEERYQAWIDTFPETEKKMFQDLMVEMEAQQSVEAKLYKALDRLEAVISHDESSIETWLPLEYDLQYTYGQKEVQFSSYLKDLKIYIDQWTTTKIQSKSQD